MDFYMEYLYDFFFTQYPIVLLSGSRYERLYLCRVIKYPVNYHCNSYSRSDNISTCP